jgi:hypothetical protein
MRKDSSFINLKFIFGLIALALLLIFAPDTSHAQWPPFNFRLTPSHNDGEITYDIRFIIPQTIEWNMRNVRIHVPLPEGTRFVEAHVDPPGEVIFEGSEVQYFVATPRSVLRNASFTVEIIDPAQTIFSTHAWLNWEGDQPGSFLTNDVSVSADQRSLDWVASGNPRLELSARVTTDNGTITYLIYPRNTGGRMWDVKVSLPIPPGTTLLSADAPAPFVVGSNEGEVAFSVVELDRQPDRAPLVVQLSAPNTGAPVVTQLWAAWKNVGRRAGLSIPAEEAIRSPDIVVQPSGRQSIVVDRSGEVPFANYDLTAVGLEEVLLPGGQGPALKVTFQAAGPLGGDDEPLEYLFFIDVDCSQITGNRQNSVGAEYRLRYRHANGRADLSPWNATANKWDALERLSFEVSAQGDSVTVWIPSTALKENGQMCWLTKARYRSPKINPQPPTEFVPETGDLRVLQYTFASQVTTVETNLPALPSAARASSPRNRTANSKIDLIPTGADWLYLPGWEEPPETWKTATFDDSAWFTGPMKIGYGPREYATDLSLATPDTYAGDAPKMVFYHNPTTGSTIAILPSGKERSLYLRNTFDLSDITEIDNLSLRIKFRDGFVAYLNGVEVARQNMGRVESAVSFTTLATKRNRTYAAATIDLSDYISELVEGENVFAIQVHQANQSVELEVDAALSYLPLPPPDEGVEPADGG